VAGGLFVLLASVSLQLGSKAPSQPNELPGLGPLGLSFLGIPQPGDRRGTTYLLPFEIVSVHLLVVLIGAAYLARAKRSRSPSTRTSVEVRA
jgi:NADH-quinone oxidoreductase subunit J